MISVVTFSAGIQKKPSLSDPSSFTRITIRPSRSSLIPSSMVASGMANQGCKIVKKLKLILRFDELLHVFSDEIRFNVDFITNPTGPQISMLQSKRDNRDCESSTATFIDGQANAVHGNRTFGYYEISQLHREIKCK